MKTVTIKVDQNGGEYYGYVKIKSQLEEFELREHDTLIVDGVEIQFDESIQVLSIK